MTFWEILALLVTAPLWVPMALGGLMIVVVAIGLAVSLPIIIIAETLRK